VLSTSLETLMDTSMSLSSKQVTLLSAVPMLRGCIIRVSDSLGRVGHYTDIVGRSSSVVHELVLFATSVEVRVVHVVLEAELVKRLVAYGWR
jgi:nitrate/nitrite transporter NarK